MAGNSISKIVVRVAVRKRYAYIFISVLCVLLILAGIFIVSSGMKERLRDLNSLLGVGYFPIFLLFLIVFVVLRLRLSAEEKIKYILASLAALSLIIVAMSYFSVDSGILGFLTNDGVTPLSGEIGVSFRGDVVRSGLIIISSFIVVVLSLVPFSVLRSAWKKLVYILVLLSRLRITTETKVSDSPSGRGKSLTPITIRDRPDNRTWSLPPFDFDTEQHSALIKDSVLVETAEQIRNKLAEFEIEVEVPIEEVMVGPTVSRYAIKPGQGVQVGQITAREEDLEIELNVDIRFTDTRLVQGAIGVEVPNSSRATVRLDHVLGVANRDSLKKDFQIIMPIGMDAAGESVIEDLVDFPHLLIGGSTNSGKSVCLNSLITSLLLFYDPTELRMILIDPKLVELSLYENIPHLIETGQEGNIITEPETAANVLAGLIDLIDDRLQILRVRGVRDIQQYNAGLTNSADSKMPYVVVVVDELARFLDFHESVTGNLTDIGRLGRAVGIHAVVATQRPDASVVPGDLKAQFPGRLALKVASVHDSRTILDLSGAQKLLGNGDMLLSGTDERIKRLQGILVMDEEIRRICEFWTNQAVND